MKPVTVGILVLLLATADRHFLVNVADAFQGQPEGRFSKEISRILRVSGSLPLDSNRHQVCDLAHNFSLCIQERHSSSIGAHLLAVHYRNGHCILALSNPDRIAAPPAHHCIGISSYLLTAPVFS
jgi:hypothetical protein